MEHLKFDLWSILILFGAFHGYILAFYFLFSKTKIEQRFFGLLLIVVALNLTEYAFTLSRLFVKFPHIILSTYPLLFLMGPFYYLNIRKLAGDTITFKSVLHFIPAILMFLFMIPFYAQDGDTKLNSYLSSIDLENPEFSPSQFIYIFLHFLHLSIYVFFSWKLIKLTIKTFKESSSNNNVEIAVYLKKITKLFIGFLIVFLTMLVFMLFLKKYSVQFDYVVVLVLSGIIYFIGYATLRQPNRLLSNQTKENTKYATSSLSPDIIEELKTRLDSFMLNEKPYINGELKISELADKLDIPPHHLSQLINQEYGTNFFDYINRFRIDEAKRMLADNQYKNEKIFAIAIDSGFNNKASFNRVFKRHTGLSPSEFKSRAANNS